MQQYVNKFQIGINDARTEVNLNFIQESPIIPLENGTSEDVETEVVFVSNLVMTYDSAMKLYGVFKEILEPEE